MAQKRIVGMYDRDNVLDFCNLKALAACMY